MDLVLPAYAGMIPLVFDEFILEEGAPRVCGDDPITLPRGVGDRVLPAYAGMIRIRIRGAA